MPKSSYYHLYYYFMFNPEYPTNDLTLLPPIVDKNELINGIVSPFIKSFSHSLQNVPVDDLIYKPLKGGGSAATLYRFDFHKHSYVLRLFPSHALPSTRTHQIMLAEQAGRRGFGPKIHFVDSQMKGIIMDFIPGRTVQESDFEDNSCLIEFAKFLKRLHGSGNNFPLAVSPFKRFRDFYSKMEKKNGTYPPRFSEVKILMEELESIFQLLPIDQVPSHLDLHPLNIMLWEKRFFLVDWVNGGVSDPYFDLTTFSVFHCLNEARQLIFLNNYFGRKPTSLEWNRFIVTQPIRLFVIALALFSSDNDTSMSYEEMIRDISLPSLSDFGKKGAIWPNTFLGVSMFQAALKLVDQDQFKYSLQLLKKMLAL